MTGLLCLMVVFTGFPQENDTNYRFMSTCLYDGDWVETEDTWYGLFQTDSMFELRKVELQLSRSTAPLLEGDRPHPFKVELVGEPDWPLIILSSSEKEFIEGPVHTAFRNYQSLVPDTSIILEAPGILETLLYTTEEGLFLSNGEVCQALSDTYPGEEFGGQNLGILWAGDLDRDGRVDLIIDDIDDGYYCYRLHLFLSAEAGPDSILEMVASFGDVYY